jgi:hypothetical protein
MVELVIAYDPREHDHDAHKPALDDDDWWTTHGAPRVDALEETVERFRVDTGMSSEAALAYLVLTLADRTGLKLETRLRGVTANAP